MTRPVARAALAEWRRIVSETYDLVRRIQFDDQYEAWRSWRIARDRLFKDHNQSPLSEQQRATFSSLSYFDYDPSWRIEAPLKPVDEGASFSIELTEDGAFNYSRTGEAQFELAGVIHRLNVYWIKGYGGGLFLPFKDRTNSISIMPITPHAHTMFAGSAPFCHWRIHFPWKLLPES